MGDCTFSVRSPARDRMTVKGARQRRRTEIKEEYRYRQRGDRGREKGGKKKSERVCKRKRRRDVPHA